MILTGFEINLLKEFHSIYWCERSIKAMHKPDILYFLVDNKKQATKRILIILSIYYFNFWRLEFSKKMPKKEIINNCFKTIKCP